MIAMRTTIASLAFAALLCGGCHKKDHDPELRSLEDRVEKLAPAASGQASTPLPKAPPSETQGGTEERIARLEQRVTELEKEVGRSLKTVRIPLDRDQSGNEACASQGHICLSVVDSAGSARYDLNNQFCGHITIDCNARVTKRLHCGPGTDYVLSPIRFYRSPGAKAQCDSTGTETCASAPSDIVAICLE